MPIPVAAAGVGKSLIGNFVGLFGQRLRPLTATEQARVDAQSTKIDKFAASRLIRITNPTGEELPPPEISTDKRGLVSEISSVANDATNKLAQMASKPSFLIFVAVGIVVLFLIFRKR